MIHESIFLPEQEGIMVKLSSYLNIIIIMGLVCVCRKFGERGILPIIHFVDDFHQQC